MIYSMHTERELDRVYPLTWVYAHGELQDFLGHDTILTNNEDVYKAYNRLVLGDQLTACTFSRLSACNDEGFFKEVNLYMWYSDESKTVRGLAVVKDNVEDKKYAIAKQSLLAGLL